MNLFCPVSLWQWLVLAYEFPDLICLSQNLQGNAAWLLEADVVVGWGLYHILERMVILQLLG